MKPSVVIVGASIAGCACAILLAQRGFELRLLDHRIALNSYKTLCTHFIQPFTNDILHELRLSHLLTSAYSMPTKAMFFAANTIIDLDGGYTDDEVFAYAHNIERRIFDHELRLEDKKAGVDAVSKQIYKDWSNRHANSQKASGSKTADMKTAIVEEFRDNKTLLIATESGGEGINMQFCSLLINYDLPWNPQRVEQRIGRVHRYGQKCDVVVVNFLNKDNKADQLVYNLLDQKFKLFEGVFGGSDEILGAIENEISIESRINDIYQKCRHIDEIEEAFSKLQEKLEDHLTQKEQETRKKLLEHFDEDVLKRLKLRRENLELVLNDYGYSLLTFCRFALPEFEHLEDGFIYDGQAYYTNWQRAEAKNGQIISVDTPLLVNLIKQAKQEPLPPMELVFDYDEYGARLYDLEAFRGRSGWLSLAKLSFNSIENTQQLIFSAFADSAVHKGEQWNEKQCKRLLRIPAKEGRPIEVSQESADKLNEIIANFSKICIEKTEQRNRDFFDEEQEKIDKWEEDSKKALELEIKQIIKQISEAKKHVREEKHSERNLKSRKRLKT